MHPPARPQKHHVRFQIRLHDGSPAAGAFVSVNGCATPDSFAESWAGDGPLFEPTHAWPHFESYSVFTAPIYSESCHVMATADSFGQLILPYSGRSRNIVLVATISHPAGKAQASIKLLRGDPSVNVRMKRSSRSDVTISCGTGPCESTNVELTVDAPNGLQLVANVVTDRSGVASFVGIPDGKVSVRVAPSFAGMRPRTWDAKVNWPQRRRELHIRFPTDEPTYAVIAEAFGKPGLTSDITASATCQFDAGAGIVYRPLPPARVVVPDGATFTFSDLRGRCTIIVNQHNETFVRPEASVTVSGAGKPGLHIR